MANKWFLLSICGCELAEGIDMWGRQEQINARATDEYAHVSVDALVA